MNVKMIFAAMLILLAAVFLLVGCGENDNDGTVVISERFFVNELEEIVFNHERYLGRTIQFEGLFKTVHLDNVDRHLVLRYRFDECCNEEMPIGLEVVMNEFQAFDADAWVEVIGTLELLDGFLVIQVTSITELDERGQELVS